MRVFKIITIAVVAISLPAVGSASAATGVDVDEGFLYEHPSTAGWQGVFFGDKGEDSSEAVSSLWGRPADDFGFLMCSTNSDANCSTQRQVNFTAMLQPCAATTALDCIVEFGHVDTSGTRVPATYVSKFPRAAVNEFAADAAAGLPLGTAAGLWRLAPGSGSLTDLHYVNTRVAGTREKGETKFVFTNFGASVNPVTLVSYECAPGSNCSPGYNIHPDGVTSGFGYGQGREVGLDCVMTGVDPTTGTMSCAKRKALSLSVNYYLKVRLSQSPRGWLHGRLNTPKISIEAVPGSGDALTIDIQGGSVTVPQLSKGMLFKDLPPALQEKYLKEGGWPSMTNGSASFTSRDGPTVTTNDPNVRNRLSIPPAAGKVGLVELAAWLPLFNDTASADISQWGVRTLQTWEMQEANKCFVAKQRLNGVVVTNATQYSAGPPELNKETNSLDYKVAAPHYKSGGAEFKGVYELFIRSDVARCLYGFNKAPIKSSIEVIERDGVQDVATTNISERDGWIQLSAYGFTHSSPTLRVRMAQGVAGFASVSKGKALTSVAIAQSARVKVSKGAKVTAVVKSGGKACAMKGARLVGRNKGRCLITLTIRSGGKTTNKVVDVAVL